MHEILPSVQSYALTSQFSGDYTDCKSVILNLESSKARPNPETSSAVSVCLAVNGLMLYGPR